MEKQPDLPNDWVTTAVAARYAKMCTKTLRKYDPILKPAFLNTRVKRYHVPSLDKFLHGNR